MNVWIRRTVQVGLVAAGLMVASATGAAAADITTEDNFGAGNGNQAVVPVQVPINACGNAASVLGNAEAGCEGGSTATMKPGQLPDMSTEDNAGILNGNQALVPVQAPINICGNSATLGGNAEAGCEGGSSAEQGGHHHTKKMAPVHGPDITTEENVGLANGNQAVVPVQVPIDFCGNAASVGGNAEAECKGGSEATLHAGSAPSMSTEDNFGILNGNQAAVPVQAPIEISGNALSVLGNAEAESEGGAEAHLG